MKPASITILLCLAALPMLAAPGAFTLSGSGQCNGPTPHIALTWSASSGATSYDVYRNSAKFVTVTGGTVFDDTSVTPNGNYSYYVRATDGLATTDSNTVIIQAPNCAPPPGAFTLTGNAFCYNAPPDQPPAGRRGAIHLSWPASSNATSYDIFRDGGLFASAPTGGGYGLDDISPGLGGHHSYYVVAKNAAGTTQSNTVDVTIPPDVCQAPPGSFTVDGSESCDTSGPRAVVSLSWTAASAATSYQIFRNNTPLASTTSTAYSDTTVNPGQSYDYKITATNSGGSTDSNTKTIAISNTICPPATPTATATATCVGGSQPAVHVGWSPTAFATSYIVKRGGTPISGTLAAEATSFDDTNVTIGQTYTYTVTASNSNGNATSAEVQAKVANLPCIPSPPGPFSARANAACDPNNAPVAIVSWDTSPGADSFVVNRNGTPVSPAITSADHFTDTTVMSGQSYNYTVTASNAGGSTTSSPAGVTVPTCGIPPASFTAAVSAFCNAGSAAVHVTWTSSTGAASYSVSRNGVEVGSGLSAGTGSFDDPNVTAGQSYSYAVTASNSTGSTTAQAGSITPAASVCPPPAFTLTANATCNQIVSPPLAMVTLNWTAAATATSYLILRNGAQIGSVDGSTTTYNDGGASSPQTYSYVVRAVGPGGSTDSNTATATVQANMCSTPHPDLAATDITYALPAGQPGDTEGVSITVSNGGSAAAPATTSRIRIGSGTAMSPSDPVIGTIATPALAPGASATQTTTVTIPSLALGTYYFFLSVDEDRVSGDVNPANDVTRSSAFTAQSPPCTLACAALVPSAAQAATPVAFALVRPPCVNDRAVWTFGDNTSATSYSPTHAYATAGTFHWTLTLTAATGESCSSSGNITITAPAAPPKRRAVRH